MKRRRLVMPLLVALFFALGSIAVLPAPAQAQEATAVAEQTTEEKKLAVRSMLHEAWKGWEPGMTEMTVDVSSVGLTFDSHNDCLKWVRGEAQWDDPVFNYFTSGYPAFTRSADGTLQTVTIYYSSVLCTQERWSAFFSALNEGLAQIQPGMTDEAKAVVLHDWMVSRCTYTALDSAEACDFAYAALVLQRARCGGLALGYMALLQEAGIQCEYVTGDNGSGSHAWVLAKLDGQWYHVDPTASTLGKGVLSDVGHAQLLMSDAQCQATSHSDWAVGVLFSRTAPSAGSTLYDNAFWKSGIAGRSIVWLDGAYFYLSVSGTQCSLMRASSSAEAGVALASLTTSTTSSGDVWNPAYYARVVTEGTYVYMNQADSVLVYNADGTAVTTCTPTEPAGLATGDAYISDLYVEDGTVKMDVRATDGTASSGLPVVQPGSCSTHVLKAVEVAPATCVAQGTAEHWKCTVCGALFSDGQGTQAATAEALALPLDPAAHTLVTKNACEATATATGYTGDTVCSACGTVTKKGTTLAKVSLTYRGHVQDLGWMPWVSNGALCGTSGQSKRLEGFNLKLTSQPYAGSIEYRAHVQNVGWQNWVADGALAGTSGRSLRVEALEVRLTGEMAEHYDVWVRAHVQNVGWQAWVKNGVAGTSGRSLRMEAVQVQVLPKGHTPTVVPSVTYQGHVQSIGWQGWVQDGMLCGTSGQSKRAEAFRIKLATQPVSGSIRYRTHVQSIGWQGWVQDGALAGTSGQSKRVEALQIQLTGAMAEQYDVWYRAHVQSVGWQGWVKDGATAGTTGRSLRIEAIQVQVLPKGQTP